MTVSPNLHLSWTAVPVADLLLCQMLLQNSVNRRSAKQEPTTSELWRFCLYVLYERGVFLIGPGPKALIGSVDIRDVREASKKRRKTCSRSGNQSYRIRPFSRTVITKRMSS